MLYERILDAGYGRSDIFSSTDVQYLVKDGPHRLEQDISMVIRDTDSFEGLHRGIHTTGELL
jgi:hypothetical protein